MIEGLNQQLQENIKNEENNEAEFRDQGLTIAEKQQEIIDLEAKLNKVTYDYETYVKQQFLEHDEQKQQILQLTEDLTNVENELEAIKNQQQAEQNEHKEKNNEEKSPKKQDEIV